MFKLTRLVHFEAAAGGAERAAVEAALRGIGGRVLVQPTLPGGYNAGDLIAHFRFDDESQWRLAEPQATAVLANAAVRHVESVAYAGSLQGGEQPLVKGVYRVLLLRVERPDDIRAVERFEADVRAMPHYIPAIRRWQLSRVAHGTGSRRWTHVWEQEYADLGGLMGPYMMHPYHWAHVDRWFDPESADRLVDPFLCHSFCALEGGQA